MPGSSSSNPAAGAQAERTDSPLDLTIHALPGPRELEEGERTSRGRLKMLFVMLICAAPVLASYFTYYVVRPEGRRNFGELVEPQRPLPPIAATGLDGKSTPLPALRGQWLLVTVGGGACAAGCERELYLQRQLREGVGREKDRVDRVWLVNDGEPVRAGLLPALKGATVLRVQPETLAQWIVPAAGRKPEDHLYVVDPMGNFMMRFPPDLDTAGAARAKRDLERLLRASGSWDKEGR
ncbi:MAG: hypothetical protein ABW051_11405 [Burkholderiaceae bacterium]